MKKRILRLNYTLLDAAPSPSMLLLFGVPLLIVVIIIALVVTAIKLIYKAYLKNKEQRDGQDSDPRP